MAYIKDVQVGSDTYLIEPTLYIAPTKNGAAYTATLANFSLATGATVQAKFAATNNENATLNVNSTGAKEIHYNGDKITANQFKVNHVYTLVYDGTQWQVVGDIDTNTNTWRGIQDNLTSDSTTESLSAKQGKVLKGLIDAMDASTPAANGNATAFIDSITQTDGKITSITKKTIPAASTSTAGIIKIGTTANDAAAGNHNHDTLYIKNSDELLTTNPFAPASLKGPYISKIDNAFYAANRRWSVTGTNISNISGLFNGDYESQSTITAGNTAVINIDFDPNHNNSAYFPGYPYGYILVSFYYTYGPINVSGRVYCNYSAHGIGWHNISFSPISDNTNGAIVYKSEHQGYYNISQLEITITANSSNNTSVTQIEMHLDRPNSARTPFLSKYNAETLYYDLTAPKFIGALQGNADTTTKFNSTRKIELTGAVTGSATTDGSSGWSLTTTIGTGKVTNAMLAGSIANEKLSNSKVTIAGNDVSLGGSLAATTLTESLGLSKAMRFIGVATVAITDGSTTDPVISGYSTKTAGDVIIDKDSSREYVWSTTGKWELLGGDSSYKTTQSTVDSGAAVTNKWVSRIQQNANGVVTVTMETLDTSGTWSGNATTATTATNLSAKPSLAASGNNITVTAGGKTSDAFTVPYATSAGSAGSATTATYIKCTDTRNTTLNPTDLTAAQGVRFDFKAKGTIDLTATDNYAGVMSFRPYASNSDWSGGNAHQIAFNSEGLHWRNGSASWGDWYQILDSDNTTAGANNTATLTWNTTYTIAKINDTDIKFTTMAKPSYAFTDLTAHPTTLGGYGITDAASSSHSHTLKIGNKSLSVSTSEQEWTVHDILLNPTQIHTDTSWDQITPGAYYVASGSAFTGTGHPGTNQEAPYTYGGLYVLRAGNGGAAQFYISDAASDDTNKAYGIRYRSGWNVINNTTESHWRGWATILDDKNFNLYAPTLTGTGASGSWGISITGTAANVSGTVAIEHGGTGATTASAAANALISKLPIWTATPTADTYFIRRDTTGTATFGQVKFSSIANITNNTLTLGPYSSTLVTSVNGDIGDVTITAADLGLSNALHFIGITSTELVDGSTTATLTAKSTNSLSKTTGFVDGDVVMDGDQLREYVWSGSAWHLLGITTSTKYEKTTSGNTFISSISQATDGTVTAESRTLDTSGTWSGNAATATTLTCPSLTTEANIESGTRSYQGSGETWTGTITSMTHAGILQVCGGYSRGWQIWAQRGDNATQSLHWRNPNSAANAWNEERIILDSGNYTNYTVKKDGTGASGTWGISITGSSASCTGNAATATAIETAGTTAQFYRGDNSWSNIIKQTASAVLGIDTNLKIGTARKDLNFDIVNGSGTGINDGYAGGITWGAGDAAYAGIYYQTSGSYGSRLIFGTTGSYANGAYARMIVQSDGKIGIGTLTPSELLHVTGNLLLGNSGSKSIYYQGTKSKNSMITFLDNTSDANGNGIKIGGGGVVVVGAGESAANMSVTVTSETLYLTSDGIINIEAGGDTIANRIGMQVTSSGHIIPVKAEAKNSNAQNLGASDSRWAKLYIGTTDSYGDAYTPIYWNSGVPAAVTLVQYCEFTIGSGKKGVKLTHAAFTAASYVTQVVVTSGESNLNSTIAWESAAGYINLTCSATSGAVSGYILVSRGGAITATATDIT